MSSTFITVYSMCSYSLYIVASCAYVLYYLCLKFVVVTINIVLWTKN